MIFTLDEEIHLPSCLKSLEWCDDVIVIDSFSTDRTRDICLAYGVRFFQHRFEGFGKQRNWALDNTSPEHDWILILDADERVPPELARELARIVVVAPDDVGAYRLRRRFFMWGQWLRRSSLYPTWVVRLVRKDRVRYVNRGHAETQEVQGLVLELSNDLIDENLKGLQEWFERQNRYSTKEAEYEVERERDALRVGALFGADPLARRMTLKRIAASLPARPLLYFLYSYFLRGGFLEGRYGFTFCCLKSIYQQMVDLKKYELRHKASQ